MIEERELSAFISLIEQPALVSEPHQIELLIRTAVCYKNEAHLRLAAVEALGEIGDMAALPDLIGILSERDIDVNQAVARALGKMPECAVTFILSATSFAPESLLPYLVAPLGAFQSRWAKAALRDFAAHPSSAVRTAALEAINSQRISVVVAHHFASMHERIAS